MSGRRQNKSSDNEYKTIRVSKSNKKKKDESFDITTYVKDRIDTLLERDQDNNPIDTLILSGGGLKGIAEMGALHYMESIDILKNITTYAGASAGAVNCVLLSIGYRPIELYQFFMNTDMEKLKDLHAYNFFNKLGLDEGKRFTLVVRKFFEAKSIDPKITFKKLYRMTKKKLIITGACINDKKTYYFSHETEPNMKVIDALRISVSIPIIFTPCKFRGKVFIDGGCTDNYPIALFKHKIDQVIGIYVSDERTNEENIRSIESFMTNTMICIREGLDINSFRGYEDHTIYIKCRSGEDKASMSAMFDCGYRVAIKYFKRLDVKDEQGQFVSN